MLRYKYVHVNKQDSGSWAPNVDESFMALNGCNSQFDSICGYCYILVCCTYVCLFKYIYVLIYKHVRSWTFF